MFKKLLQFEIFYQLKQRALPVFTVLFFALGVFVSKQGFAPKGVYLNALYQVYFYTSVFTLGSVFIIMFFAISAMLRDKQHNMEGLIYSTPIKKRYFFWSRFLGTFIFSLLAFSPFLLGFAFGILFFDLDPERLTNFQILTYLQPWLYMVLPNVFICSVIIFSVSTLTRNSTATYVSAVFICTLYFVCSIFLNSPFVAQSVPASPESMALAALVDPFGIAAFFEQTQYWTAFQKNTQLLSFSGLFLLNRLIWLLISIGILLTTYRFFSFRTLSKKVKKESKQETKDVQTLPYLPKVALYTLKAQRLAFFSLLKLELKNVFRSLPFIAVLLMWLFIVFSELYSTIISGGEYGVSVYPFTNQLIELIVDPLTIFSLILIIFYSSEITWRERHLNFNPIIDSTPVKNWILFASKICGLLALPMILLTTGVLMCIAFQLSLGYTILEFKLYGLLYYYYGIQLVVFSMIAIFVNALVKTKYMGMGIFGLIVLLSVKSGLLGLEHPLSSLGFMPRVGYSNMDGFNGNLNLFNHLSKYWLAFGFLLMSISFKIWSRGAITNLNSKLKQLKLRWTKVQKIVFTFCLMMFIGMGSLVFYNVNIVSEYETINDQLNFSEHYERKYKTYESLDRLYRTSMQTEVDIYPKEKMYTVKANYMLKNNSDKPISEVFITERIPLKHCTIEHARLVQHDKRDGIFLFQFNAPLQPDDSVQFMYQLTHKIKGYETDYSIVNNGTYINRFSNFDPILGYNSGLEIKDRLERKRRNLPERLEEDNSDAHIVLEDIKFEKVRFETIMSTDRGQIALSSGRLIHEWTKGDRAYYHYKSKDKILPAVGYISGEYKTKKTTHKGVSIEQYYDENHAFNVNDIEHSVIQTLEYCQENFGIYPFDYVRIAEVPSHWPFGGFAHPGVISMTEDRMHLVNVSDEQTFNLVAKRTIHEVAHQWWGHTLSVKPVAGGALFVEGFAKYTEAVVMERMFGKRALYTLGEYSRNRYFRGRAFDGGIEPPVYKVDGQSYISYGKALTVMLALRDLLGEAKVNAVLKTITDRHRYINKLEANTVELLDEIYKVAPQKDHDLINDWFKKVITYDLSIKTSTCTALDDGTYEIVVNINAKRFETEEDGDIKQIDIDEPIKIGVFKIHPSMVSQDDSVLYYQSNRINKEITELRFIVNEKPSYISIDPYGTRSDENLTDNIKAF